MRVFRSIEDLRAAEGDVLGTSDWLAIDQKRIDGFADATGDHQWIHVDPERAASGPFGGTIAHGYLTLSLLPYFASQNYRIEGARMSVNYGLNKVRFVSPVRVGSRLRGTTELLEVADLDTGAQLRFRTTIELEGSEKPACVAETLSRQYF
ncbi:dehydratase [Actinomadura sp. LD22]|uniref:Dehydratase n=1 Tax=Actinomadura physcomitrii TaxID=2650748 RepID=A0A6I4MJX8_9ACTN|nr:MaoC family dehydratase [Actinomadura physcomitrii]MWA04885.1 dehydratase [Actinomadura physcomitrii]